MRTVRRTLSLTIPGVVLAGSAALLLAGCASPGGSSSASSSAPSTPQPSSSASQTQTFAQPCSTLVGADVLKQLDAGLAPVAKPVPPTYGFAVDAVAAGGQLCEWTDSANGTTLTVVVAKTAKAASAQAKVAAGSTTTDLFGQGVKGYIANAGGTASGDISVFTNNGMWISVASPLFATPAKAQSIVSYIAQALPSG